MKPAIEPMQRLTILPLGRVIETDEDLIAALEGVERKRAERMERFAVWSLLAVIFTAALNILWRVL